MEDSYLEIVNKRKQIEVLNIKNVMNIRKNMD